MKKKLIALLVVVALVFSALFVLTACDNSRRITIWVSEVEGMKTLTEEQVAKFIEANPEYADKYDIVVEGISESNSASQMSTDVKNGADIYCFAQDQLARLIQAGALSEITGKAADAIKADNDAGAVNAASQGGKIYCFPITSDNGYFMFYDKSVVSEDHIGKLEDIITDVVSAGKIFAMETETSAWYVASFFFATGCHSNWTKSADGKSFASLDDDFNSANGIISMKAMHKLTSLGEANYKSSSDASEFSKGAAVLVSGTWAAKDVKTILGDNMGVAKLPTFTVDGKEYQMGSYSGNKLMGVKPHSNAQKQAFCQNLAAYLSGEECQMDRFESQGWGPSNKNAQANDAVKADPALVALAAQNVYATPQGQIHGGWWDVAKLLGTESKKDTVADYEAALKKYDADCQFLLSLTEEQMNAFTVIGAINGTNWDTDFEMTEDPAGTWISKEVFELAEGDEFKVRKGLSWDTAYGKDGGNYVVETAGKYRIKLVVDGDDGTISLVPAE